METQDSPIDRGELPNSPSEFQRDCEEYYRLLRLVHTGVYSASKRKDEEFTKHRYTAESPTEMLQFEPFNLNTFFTILHNLLGDGSGIHGIDFGCGSHWFVDHVRRTHKWAAIGYDPGPLAIELAKQIYESNAESYRHHNPLMQGLPVDTNSQDFVVCNAVLQHFDDDECKSAISEVARVLKPGGYCLLIFKCWMDSLNSKSDPIAQSLKILDAQRGKVLFEDPTMKKEIAKLDASQRKELGPERAEGWRLLHLFQIDWIINVGKDLNLTVAEQVPVSDEIQIRGIITYRSGKGIPTVGIFLRKGTVHA